MFKTLSLIFTLCSSSLFATDFRITSPAGMVVVSEGEHEPRSIGSYAIRLYANNEAFPFDQFLAGQIRPRNGSVERVLLHDVDGDADNKEIIVIIRAAGSGGYLSADAYRLAKKPQQTLIWLGGVSDLNANADPLAALRTQLSAP